MKSLYLPLEHAKALQGVTTSFNGALLREPSDLLLAYVEDAENTSSQILFFCLELTSSELSTLTILQRLLASIVAGALGAPFSRQKSHIHYFNERISFVDYGTFGQVCNARIGLYLPRPSSELHVSALNITSFRLPSPVGDFAAEVLARFMEEYDDILATGFALKITPGRVKD